MAGPSQTMSQKICVGLDFGATFSGFDAWTTTGQVGLPPKKFVTGLQIDSSKRPHFIGPNNPLRDGNTQLSYFKFLIYDGCDFPEGDYQDALPLVYLRQIVEGNSSTEVVAEYMEGLWRMASNKYKLLELFKTGTYIQVVITFPMVWSQGSLNRFKEAVGKTTIANEAHQVGYLHEHVAAANSIAFDNTYRRNLPPFAGGCSIPSLKDVSIIIADCGGMTVDTTVYRFGADLSSGTTFECNSAFLGAFVLDETFVKVISQKYNAMPGKRWSSLPSNSRAAVMKSWRDAKQFLNLNSFPHNSCVFEVGDCQVQLHRDDLLHIFDSVVVKMVAIIAEIYGSARAKGRTPKALFVVGGMAGMEPFTFRLRHRLVQELGKEALEIVVRWDPDGVAAVKRGAAMSLFMATRELNGSPPS